MASAPAAELSSLEGERSGEVTPVVYVGGTVVLLLGAAALGWTTAQSGPASAGAALAAVLHVAAGLAAAATAALLLAGTHVVGLRQRDWAGVVALLAAVGIAGRLVAEMVEFSALAGALTALWPAGLLTGSTVAVAAVVSPSVRRLRQRTLLALAIGVQVILTAAPGPLAGTAAEAGVPIGDLVLTVAAAAAMGAAALCLYRGTCTRDQVLAALGVMLVGFATAELVDILGAWPVAGALLRTSGVVAAGYAAWRYLSSGITLERRRVADAVAGSRVNEARAQALRREADERARQESVILTSLEAAWTVLRDGSGRVDDATAGALGDAIDSELERLRALVDRPPQPEPMGFFRCEQAVERALDAASCDPVTVAVPADLHAAGSPAEVSEAIGLLLREAQQHSDDSLQVTARREGEHVRIRIDTGKPSTGGGQPAEHRFQVLAPYVKSPADVLVARRLLADQGGALGVAENPGGPFLVLLPRRPKPVDGLETQAPAPVNDQ